MSNSTKLLKEYVQQVLSTVKTAGSLRNGEQIRPPAGSNINDDSEEDVHNQNVCVLIQLPDGRVLGVSRKNDSNAWGLPGGRVDSGETLKDAAARELFEETGLSSEDLHLIFSDIDLGEKCSVFTGNISGKINTSESGLVKWISIQELLNGPFGTFNLKLFKHLGKI